MVLLRIFNLLVVAAGLCSAGQVAVFPLPVWPGTSAAGLGNRYFHEIPVPVAVPDAVAASSINHGYNAGGLGGLRVQQVVQQQVVHQLPNIGWGIKLSPGIGTNAEAGTGHTHQAQHFENQGQHDQQGYKLDRNHDILSDGNHEKFIDAGHQGDSGEVQQKFHDEASHHKDQHESAKGVKAAKFGEKKGHKRGHKTKGYHNKFHKDEYHKEHRFYDDLDKSGHHGKYGKFHANHGKNEHARKKGSNHKSGHDEKEFGKQGFSDKGRFEDEHIGHTKKGGHESYHKHHDDYAKEQGFTGGAANAYIQGIKH